MTIPPFEKLLAIADQNREDLEVGNIAIGQDVAKKGEVVAEYAPPSQATPAIPMAMQMASTGPSPGLGCQCYRHRAILTGGQREIDLRTAGEQVDEDRLNRDKIVKTWSPTSARHGSTPVPSRKASPPSASRSMPQARAIRMKSTSTRPAPPPAWMSSSHSPR